MEKKKVETWGDRLTWFRRMPMKYRILFGTQAIIFGFAIQFRLSDLGSASVRVEEQKQQETEKRTT